MILYLRNKRALVIIGAGGLVAASDVALLDLKVTLTKKEPKLIEGCLHCSVYQKP